MKIKTLTAALACAFPMTGAFAAAMDRSGQSISAFLQPNNYAEAGISVLDPDVTGKEAGTSTTSGDIDDMAKTYVFGSAAIKVQPASKFSFGILYDQPFGADAKYTGENVFVSNDDNTILPQATLDQLTAQKVESTFSSLTSAQIVGLALKGDGVDLTTAEGQATYAQKLTAYSKGDTATITEMNAGARETIAAGVTAAIAEKNALLGTGATDVKVKTESLSFVFGFQPTENWNVYGGPVYQTIEGSVSLRGQAYSLYNGYDAEISKEGGWGWMAGLAYQIPEIALKASLTYRSEIDYNLNIDENMPTLSALELLDGGEAAAAAIAASSGQTDISFPQSVNLDLQSGIMADTIAFAQLRWVDWSSFSIRPYKFGLVSEVVGPLPQVNRPNGFNLVEYSEDQISANVGLGRKMNDKWSGTVSVGWDSGTGDPVSTLGPTEGYWNLGLGVQYSPAANYFVQAGAKYFWLGDAQAQTGSQATGNDYVAEFEDNNAVAYGLKLGYRF